MWWSTKRARWRYGHSAVFNMGGAYSVPPWCRFIMAEERPPNSVHATDYDVSGKTKSSKTPNIFDSRYDFKKPKPT